MKLLRHGHDRQADDLKVADVQNALRDAMDELRAALDRVEEQMTEGEQADGWPW